MESETTATYEEIWDDSALVNSWNEALEEYKKYHSIHLKGGTIDDIPNGGDQVTRRDGAVQPETNEARGPIAEQDGSQEEGEVDERGETSHAGVSDIQGSGNAAKSDEKAVGSSAVLGPQTLLGNVQDEELKRLLMSWYYAGYYTGLFEGKQQGLKEAEQAQKGA